MEARRSGDSPMNIAYITAQIPWGRGETFIIDEMLAVKAAGANLVIIPRNPTKEVFHREARTLLENAVRLPLMNSRIIGVFLFSLLTKPRLYKILGAILHYSRTWHILIKNLAVVPKGVYITLLVKKKRVEHIHAHWGSTTATMALVTSELTSIPWSFTLHRWDIKEDNMLKFKVQKAAFARCIAEDGRSEVLRIIGEAYQDQVKMLHLGVQVPDALPMQAHQLQLVFVIACPANFVPVKGHRFLVEACALLMRQETKNFQCLLIGDGPLEESIRQQVAELGVGSFVKFLGRLPHDELLRMYKNGKINAIVLPSIVTSKGDKEGIPVALMEAMAYGIPVISTIIGGIPELVQDDAGLLVPPASVEALANAISQTIHDEKLWHEITKKAHERIRSEFNLHSNVQQLLNFIVRLRE